MIEQVLEYQLIYLYMVIFLGMTHDQIPLSLGESGNKKPTEIL